jgi:hypothetical protein
VKGWIWWFGYWYGRLATGLEKKSWVAFILCPRLQLGGRAVARKIALLWLHDFAVLGECDNFQKFQLFQCLDSATLP